MFVCVPVRFRFLRAHSEQAVIARLSWAHTPVMSWAVV